MRSRTLLARPWGRYLDQAEPTAERLTVHTPDGAVLNVLRVRNGAGGLPVLLLHGLGANRMSFHFPERSLAHWLAQRGFDCFVPELRGCGESQAPGRGWDLEDHLVQDLPALFARIQEETGQAQVAWVGHSMGGILLLCHGIRTRQALGPGVALGSALDYRGTAFEKLLFLRPLLGRLPVVPWDVLAHWAAPFLGRAASPFDQFNVWPTNIEPKVIRRIHANGFSPIAVALLESLASAVGPGGLASRDGSVRYLERGRDYQGALQLFAGSRDQQCPEAAARRTAEQLGRPGALQVFGSQTGCADEYGHWDLLLGKRAPEEVWPRVEKALRQRAQAPA